MARLRLRAGLTQIEAAEELEIGRVYLNGFETGQRRISRAVSRRMARLYRVRLSAVIAASEKAVSLRENSA